MTRESLVYAHYKWNSAFKYFSSSLVESVVESTNTEADGILAGKQKSPGDGQEQPICVKTVTKHIIVYANFKIKFKIHLGAAEIDGKGTCHGA